MSDACIHIANLFYLASFAGKDMLRLRILTCCGLLFGIAFFTTCHEQPMYSTMFWHVVFLSINVFRIFSLLRERAAERQAAALADRPIGDGGTGSAGGITFLRVPAELQTQSRE